MYLVNRDGRQPEQAAKLDAFFEAEEADHPNYRRFFRFLEKGPVINDLQAPLRWLKH